MTDAFLRAAETEANTPITVGAGRPTPEELAKTHLAVSIDRYRNEIPKVPISTLIFEAFLAGLAEGERRRQKRDAEIVSEFRTKHPLYLSEIQASILAEGGGE